jgi:hypothetical protein
MGEEQLPLAPPQILEKFSEISLGDYRSAEQTQNKTPLLPFPATPKQEQTSNIKEIIQSFQ